MASVNKVILVGNLGRDPELQYTQSGVARCVLAIATTEVWSDATGNRQEKTEWHRVTAWKKQAENCAKYLAKGKAAYVEGKIQTRSWDDAKSGEKRYQTEIVATDIKFLGSGVAASGQPKQGNQRPKQASAAPPEQAVFSPPPQYRHDDDFGSYNHSSLDDLPF